MSTVAQGGAGQGAVARGRGAGRRLRWDGRKITVGLVFLVWLVHTLVSWLGGYRVTSMDDLHAAVDQGRVTSLKVAQDLDPDSARWWEVLEPVPTAAATWRNVGAPWDIVYHVEDSLRPRVAMPGAGPYSRVSGSTWWDQGVQEELAWAEEKAADLRGASGATWPSAVVGLTGVLLALGAVLRIVGGARPRHGTRWFWFWMIGLPAGLGALLYFWLEVGPWQDRRAPAEDDRPNGFGGFAIMFFGGILLTVLGRAALDLVGSTVIPL